MLERLLQILQTGGAHTYGELARDLGISENLLEAMLEDLGRLGYLKPVLQACPGHCQGCAERGTCAIAGQGRIWTLTEKGAKALHKSTN